MKILFFDTESSNGRRIIEFGYVITNEKFEVLERDNILINPNDNNWDWFVIKNLLTYKKYEYLNKNYFIFYYDRIKKVIESVDFVFGHTLDSDVKRLNDEISRYNLKSIDFVFYDIKTMYSEFANTKRSIGLVEMIEKLGIENCENSHNAEADSYNTMLTLKDMLEKLEVSLLDMVELCPNSRDKTENLSIESYQISKLIREEKFHKLKNGDGTNTILPHSINKNRFMQFLDNVKSIEKLGSNKLKNKKISISINYEKNHYKEMLNLVQLIKNEGGSYILKASQSDMFFKYDLLLEGGSISDCSRLNHVKEENDKGNLIEILEFQDLLMLLDITEEELENKPIPSFDFLLNENTKIRNPRERRIINGIIKVSPKNKEERLVSHFGDFIKAI